MSITLEQIAQKVEAARPIRNVKGQLISLTNQQRHVVVRACRDGLTTKQIAKDLGESMHSIKHLQHAAMKLAGVRKLAQLGVWAAKQGLV